MIIAEICNYAADYSGNFLASLRSMEEYARSMDNNNKIICVFPISARGKDWVGELQENHKVFFLEGGILKSNIQLLRWCNQYHVDIIHVHFYGLITGCFVGWFSRTMVVHHFHNTWSQPNLVKNAILRIVSSSARSLVGCSKAVFDTLIDAGFSHKKTTFITNCIDFSRLDLVKENNPYHNSKNNILILGTDFYRKGVNFALNAIEPIADELDIQLNVISHCVDETMELIIEEMGYMPKWVNVIHPVENIGDYYRASALFLSPSLAEGLCYAVPEALYCHCMTLKTNIPSLTYGLVNEDQITLTGIEELRNRIIGVMKSDNDVISERINSLRSQVIDYYNVAKWGREVYTLYKDLFDSK